MRHCVIYHYITGPENIRQLENEIERAVTLAEEDSLINSTDLSPEVYHFQENAETLNLLEDNSLKAQVERLERVVITQALDETGGNQTQAAKKLGMSRQGLIKKSSAIALIKVMTTNKNKSDIVPLSKQLDFIVLDIELRTGF